MAHALPFTLLLVSLLPVQDTPQQPAAAAPKAPDTVTARRGTLRQTLQRSGWLVPADARAVSLDFEAYAGELEIAEFVPPGSMVNEGDILVRFEPKKLDEQLRQAELEMAHAEQRAQMAREEERLTDESERLDLVRAEKDLEWSRKRLKGYLEKEREFEKESDRLGRQSSRYGIEDQQDELAQLEKMYKEDELVDATEEIVIKRARRRLAQTQAQVNLSERQRDHRFELEVAIRQESLELEVAQKQAAFERLQKSTQLKRAGRQLTQEKARFDLEKQRGGLDKLRRDRERLTVRAPMAGILLYGDVEAAPFRSTWRKGSKLAAAAVQLTVAKTGPYKVVFDVPEEQILKARTGKAAQAKLEALPDLGVTGEIRVDWLPSAREGSTNRYRAELPVASSDARLRPGLASKVTVVLEEAKDAVLVAKDLVSRDGEAASVLVVGADGTTATERKVKLGIDDGKDVVIESGLEAGEVVRRKAK